MTSAPSSSERVQEFLTFGAQLVTEAALPILSRGYTELVDSLRVNEELAEVAQRDGVDAALNHPTLGVLRKARQEFATPAELRAERAMTDRVLATEKFSGHSVLGEELGAADQISPEGGPNIRWVFDPVDGTTSMLRMAVAQANGIELPDPQPAFGVTIGVLEGDEAIAGVVAELRPHEGAGLEITRLWTGGSGVPATCNGQAVTAGVAMPLEGATLASTVPEVMFHSAAEWRDFQALYEVAARCVTGQNCIGFMELLGPDGHFHVVFERDLTAPDTAALIPILAAAGVQATDAQGNPPRFGPEDLQREYVVLAAHPKLHEQALQRILSGPNGPSTFGQWKEATGVDVAKTTRQPMDIAEVITKLARPQVLALTPYSSARKEGEQNEAWTHHDANEMLYPPYPGTLEQEGLNRYPEPQPSHLLDIFAQLFEVPREQLLLSRGADEAIDLLTRVFCRENVDSVLIHPPTFAMYEHSAHVQGAAIREVPLLADDFQLDVPRILDTCRADPNVKLVFVCSPNNPTGNLLRREDVLELSRNLAGQALIVVDETYVAYSGQPSFSVEIARHPNVVVLRTVSKENALAGERCGILIAHPEVISLVGRIHAPYPLTVSGIRAVTVAMSAEGIDYARRLREQILRDRHVLEQALATSPAVQHIYPSDANFLLIRTTDPKLLVQIMEEKQIKIRDRSAVVPGCVRISVGQPEQNDRLLAVFEEYARRVALAESAALPLSR